MIPPAGPQPEPEPGSQPGSEPTTHRPPLVIDAHGHFTTTPPAHQRFRDAQLARLSHLPGDQPRAEPAPPPPVRPAIGDDELRESVQNHQLKVLRERGGDLMLFSPKASGMEHHVADPATARDWARQSNDLVARVTYLFPRHFAGVCQLPQTPGGPPADSVAELRRCVETLGFVGCNLNPDPSGGYWTAPR